jgi:hypothetical protein
MQHTFVGLATNVELNLTSKRATALKFQFPNAIYIIILGSPEGGSLVE